MLEQFDIKYFKFLKPSICPPYLDLCKMCKILEGKGNPINLPG